MSEIMRGKNIRKNKRLQICNLQLMACYISFLFEDGFITVILQK